MGGWRVPERKMREDQRKDERDTRPRDFQGLERRTRDKYPVVGICPDILPSVRKRIGEEICP